MLLTIFYCDGIFGCYTRGAGWAGRPGPTGPGGPGGGSPRFFPRTCLFDFLLLSENFKGSLKKDNAVLGHSFSDYLIG
jgi:hypothetical protein